MKEVLYVIELCESGMYEQGKFLCYTNDIQHAKSIEDSYSSSDDFHINIIEVGFLGEVKMSVLDTGKQIMQEYLKKTDIGYKLVLQEEVYDGDDIKIPVGATRMVELATFKGEYRFFKVSNKGLHKWSSYLGCWNLTNCKTILENLGGHNILWDRDIQEPPQELFDVQKTIDHLTQQEVLKYFEMYLKGVDIQFKLNKSTESQWNNMKDKSMDAFKHPNVQLREKPRYVTLDGVTFKTAYDLLLYVKEQYNLDHCVFKR